MKQLATNYSFNAAVKTVTLTGLDVPLSYVLLIINATRNQIIYNLAEPALGAAFYQQGVNSVITLKADLAGMANTDQLTIFYDNGAESQIVLVQGPVGPQGPAGIDGQDGAVGPAGPQGLVGPQGPQGPAGIDGQDGAVGPAGPQGPVGPQGEQGPAGIDGQDGAVGPAGPRGPQGVRGWGGFEFSPSRVGADQYKTNEIVYYGGSYWICLADNDAIVPSQSQGVYWQIHSLVGAEGPQGPAGPQGPVGPQGEQGGVGPAGTTSWSGLIDKPTLFDPAAHASTHAAVAATRSRLPILGLSLKVFTQRWRMERSPPLNFLCKAPLCCLMKSLGRKLVMFPAIQIQQSI